MHAIKMSTSIVVMAMSISALALNVTTDGPVARYYSEGRSILVVTNTCNVTVEGSGALELLAIGGGGGGGANHENLTYGGGGGGAGGVVHKVDLAVSPGTTRLVVGSGGGLSENGGDTSVFGITAFGGGAGASYLMRSIPGDGGSGGGATYNNGAASPQSGGAAVYGGSDNVGNRGANSSNVYGAAGGGGAGAAAEDCTGSSPGIGGEGLPFAITGEEVWYAGGGSGYRTGNHEAMSRGGKGGGGAGGQKGEDGKGGGGGGGAVGGCGVVVISFVPDAVTDSKDFFLSGGDDTILLTNATVHVFRNDGTLDVTGTGILEVLLVGGGGGGGTQSAASGGGGAGGLVHLTNFLVTAGSYSVKVGRGGDIGVNGGDSSFAGVIAFGGGHGGYQQEGAFGGSGGGGACSGSDTEYKAGGQSVYSRYGNVGNDGGRGYPHIYKTGGGGGAGEAGSDGTDAGPGDGGAGLAYDITGRTLWYAGGGGGGEPSRGAKGGLGGGGDPHVSGEDGLGGGGGNYAAGGDGVVIIRYAKAFYEDQFEGATGGTIRRVKGGCVHTFTENGTFTMPVNGLVEILMVGGGGGGGTNDTVNGYGGAGGGAGGLIYKQTYVLPAGEHPVVIGIGGDIAQNGGDTQLEKLTAYGGGAGASHLKKSPARDGASGGGATFSGSSIPNGKAVCQDSDNLGNNGGNSSNPWGAAGGGGAGAAASDCADGTPGVGGDGLAFSISGDEVWYAGGGSGYRRNNTSGGMSRGGKGGGGVGGQKGTDGLGGGGGGGAAGGSGVVIIRYATPRQGFVLIFR